MLKTILIDLDGVLNTYSGNFQEEFIPVPREGVKNFLCELAKNYKIEIFTTRNKKITLEWLQQHDLDKYICDVTDLKKTYTSLFIDDRALRFNGDYEKTLEEIENFKVYWKE